MASFLEIINSDKPVLIDFHATWCGPCKTLSPIIQQVSQEMGEAVRVIKIDVDKNQAIAQKYQIRGVPTMMIFKKGLQLWRQSGVFPKEAIKAELQKHL
ncbi:MAG: thioredoxin [Crocinitomicaceae bacterium]|nr:thioredoxin [Crocinitomicaceae bacterium]|tara:strand:+ start:189 stop:485 length:297 start_codon:yes stop_codon:yes gene_type:complete